jgi:Ca2+-binding RTX toxin-like protein
VHVRLNQVSFALLAAAILAVLAPPADAAPSCAQGPQIVGSTYYGTPCDDTIRAPRNVTTVYGEGGNDTLYGQRGNDFLYGGDGNDRLYGGIGDDQLRGGPGDDLLSGGFGADSALDGEAGDDLVRGDATIDRIENTGGGFDTLSYATGVTPGFFDRSGFPHFSAYEGFPQSRDGRGVYVDLGLALGDNGSAPEGGGYDEEVAGDAFDVVVGTPFDDYLVGTGGAETFYGGGGADVILGGGGGDTIFGGAEGDYCAEGVAFECEFEDGNEKVQPRNPSTGAVGEMAPGNGRPAALYLTGSDAADELVASYADPAGPSVQVTLAGGATSESFNLSEPPDSVLLAGLDGNDTLTATGFPENTSLVLLGGNGEDRIAGGDTEDALVDGPGNDEVHAGGGDDAVPNNEGADRLYAEAGEDLFVDDAVCEGDLLDGGADRDNANWANFKAAGVSIDMATGRAGLVGPSGLPDCEGAPLTTISNLEDIEGTSRGDVLIGDSGPNQLLGRPGPDRYYAGPGDDSILANSGVPPVRDPDPTIDCGEGWDTALIDFPENGPDAEPVDCEDVEERAPNSFRPPGTPPNPNPPIAEASSSPPPVRVDRTPPRTRLLHRPAKRPFARRKWRRVAFAFASNEPGAHFRCRIDRRPYRACGSPRVFNLRLGRHVFRAFAIDAAGNRDRSPVVYRFAVRRLSVHLSRSHRRRGSNR